MSSSTEELTSPLELSIQESETQKELSIKDEFDEICNELLSIKTSVNSLMLKCTVGKRRLTWGPLVTWHTASQRLSRPCPVSWSRLTPQPLKPKLWG